MSLMKWTTIGVAAMGSFGTIGIVVGVKPIHQIRAVTAAPTRPATSDPAAISLLQRMEATYGKLTAYSDVETSTGGEVFGIPGQVSVKYRRPSQFALEVTSPGETKQSVADDRNDNYWTSLSKGKSYTRWPITKSRTAYSGVLLAVSYQVGMEVVPFLLENDQNLIQGIFHDKANVDYRGDPETIDGVICDTVLVAMPHMYNPSWSVTTLCIGHEDHLIRRYGELIPDTNGRAPIDYTVNVTAIQTNPILADSDFQFKPAPGAKSEDRDQRRPRRRGKHRYAYLYRHQS